MKTSLNNKQNVPMEMNIMELNGSEIKPNFMRDEILLSLERKQAVFIGNIEQVKEIEELICRTPNSSEELRQ